MAAGTAMSTQLITAMITAVPVSQMRPDQPEL